VSEKAVNETVMITLECLKSGLHKLAEKCFKKRSSKVSVKNCFGRTLADIRMIS